jgi:hypothetical protein
MIVRCDGPGTYEQAMRSQRDAWLADSDWTQTLDAPLSDDQREAWAVYRQALRDFPSTWTAGPTAEFPDPPGVS